MGNETGFQVPPNLKFILMGGWASPLPDYKFSINLFHLLVFPLETSSNTLLCLKTLERGKFKQN